MSAIPVAAPPVLHAPGFWKRALAHRSFVIGAVLSALLVLAALLSLVWTPYSPYNVNMADKLLAPDSHHWLGTDPYGRDVASLLLVGARASIVVGVVAVSMIAERMAGKAKPKSASRMMISSTQPRRAAASRPKAVPMIRPMLTATTPTTMEARAPTSSRDATSRP